MWDCLHLSVWEQHMKSSEQQFQVRVDKTQQDTTTASLGFESFGEKKQE